MGTQLSMRGSLLVAACAVALCVAQEAEWLQLEARPDLEPHMQGVGLSAPYFDCQCSGDMQCMCNKLDDFTESFLEERESLTEDSASGSGSASASGSAEEEKPKDVDLDAKTGPKEVDDSSSASGSGSGNGTADDSAILPRDPNLDKPRPYFIDPRKALATNGCGKPSCMKVDIFCANKKKSPCQKKGECCMKARKEQKFLRQMENSNYKKQKVKEFEEFQQVVAADGKLWHRIEKLDLWREKGQAREQVDEAMKMKTADYDGKLGQLQAAYDARMSEKANLDDWKTAKVAYFASRMGQMDKMSTYLDSVKDEIEARREEAVKSFKSNEQRMDDYLAGSEGILKAREDKIVDEEGKLQLVIDAAKAAKKDKDVEDVEAAKKQEKAMHENTGPLPVTPEARDGKAPKSDGSSSDSGSGSAQ